MLKKNWYLFAPVAVLGLPALILAYYLFSFGYGLDDSIKATTHFVQSSTRYSLKFDELRFRRVVPGLDGRQVFELLGVPFERRDSDTVWVYALGAGTAKAHHERLVIFARDNKGIPRVSKTVRGFHVNP
jgi:hypothetical protein